jgi:hypothetical protein
MEQQFGVAPFARQCKSANTGADGAFWKVSNFEPGRPLDIAPATFSSRSGWWELRMPWDRPFDQPVPLPSGPPARTLRDAAKYIKKLPKSEYDRQEWRLAVQMLIDASEDRGPMLFARIGITRALERQPLPAFDPSRKSTPA